MYDVNAINAVETDFDPEVFFIQDNLTLREYQLKNLEIVKYFDQFCREHNIKYYLCGGACIGALRHKGFIPWDCDVDIFMLRPDYERLECIWNKYADTEHYSYDRTTERNNMHAQCAGIKDNYTTYIRSHNIDVDMNHGIMLDIIPLDALADTWIERQMQRINGIIFCLFNAQRLPNQESGVIRKMAGIILSVFKSPKVRYKIWKSAERKFTKYNTDKCQFYCEMTTGINNLKLKFPREWFNEPSNLQFEDTILMGPTETEKYTELRYPNFMAYPPVNQRLPKMSPAYIDLNTPYTKYRGIKYCVKK